MDEEKKMFNENKEQMSENEEENPQTSQLDYESDSSTNSDVEKCPICLLSFDSQEIGRPAVCSHSFCFLCILEWTKVVKTCPIDRKEFDKIHVFENLDSNNPTKSVGVSQQISLNEFTNGEESEFTRCEHCGSTDREDVMLLCDGCDKGFHMDCLDPALLEIPQGNWYCINCDRSDEDESESEEESEMEEADIDEINDLQNEIEQEIGQLPSTRLRNRQQPQIIRTLQSERIRNAILARRSLRSVAQSMDMPSTSQQASLRNSIATTRKPVKRRKTTRRRRRRVTKVVEYEIKDGQKFPIKTTRVVRRRKRKSRKTKKGRKTAGRRSCGTSKGSSLAASFKNSNSNVYDLQKGRQLAGLSNFNIFEPTYQLDYVPDEDFNEEFEQSQNAAGSTLIQSVVSYQNPLRRQAIIKKRVIENFTTTSSNINLIDSILGESSPFDITSSSNKSLKEAAKDNNKIKKSTNNQEETNTSAPQNDQSKNQQENHSNNTNNSSIHSEPMNINNPTTSRDNHQNENVENSTENITSIEKTCPTKKKKKSTTFDMFGDSPENRQDEEEPPNNDICPNFSIYGSVNRSSDENLSQPQQDTIMNEENVDLVQMSDGEHNISEEIEPAVVRSQPASPDLENDPNDQIIGDERSYTPPIVQKEEKTVDEASLERRSKKDKDHHRKHKRRELERYNVRERLKEKSPRRARDRFGRNRTRSRSRSNEKYSRRKKSRSNSRDRHRSRHKKSRTPEKRRKRSYSRSLSRRDSSNERRKRQKSKQKKSQRRTRSRSLTPQRYRGGKSPRRRDRSTSDKSKKKKRRNRSRDEKSSAVTHTKEVFTSGQNILVSVNFSNNNNNSTNSNQDDKRSTRSKSGDDKDETIVDITAKKKINVNSKPVAIIDLARSPFKELTPDYKKESNVIELSDSDGGEKHLTVPKSPDSTKLYDPFDILNSPSNENVSSSQTTTLKALNKNSVDFTNKLGPAIIKNLNLPLITNNEENLVSSSSSVNIFEKPFPPISINNSSNNSKIEVLNSEIIEIPSNNLDATIESPYSPGNDYDDPVDEEVTEEPKSIEKASATMFDELFGSTTPPFLEKAKSSKKSSSDPDKYLTKLKRQERVVEEVKLVIKPYYSRRVINKDQYKEIMRKAVPKICHNKSGEINPSKIKHLIDSYVKLYMHKKKKGIEEIF